MSFSLPSSAPSLAARPPTDLTTGVWTFADARRGGHSRVDIERELRACRWRRLHRGVYARGDTVPMPDQRGQAALLAAGEPAVLGFRSAARCYGMTLIDDDDPLRTDPRRTTRRGDRRSGGTPPTDRGARCASAPTGRP